MTREMNKGDDGLAAAVLVPSLVVCTIFSFSVSLTSLFVQCSHTFRFSQLPDSSLFLVGHHLWLALSLSLCLLWLSVGPATASGDCTVL